MKKIIDHNGRVYGKISVIDLIVLFALLFLSVAVYMKNTVMPATATMTPLTVEIKGELATDYILEALRVGDELYDQDRVTGGPIGTIVDIEVFPGEQYRTFYDGTYEKLKGDEEYNFIITLEGEGIYQDGRYSFNRVYELGVNASRVFETKFTKFTGVVLSVSADQ